MSPLFGVFSCGSLVKETATTSGKVSQQWPAEWQNLNLSCYRWKAPFCPVGKDIYIYIYIYIYIFGIIHLLAPLFCLLTILYSLFLLLWPHLLYDILSLSAQIQLKHPLPSWIKFNVNRSGYYRVNYPHEMWQYFSENFQRGNFQVGIDLGNKT